MEEISQQQGSFHDFDFSELEHEELVWSISFLIMVLALLLQVTRCLKRKFCLSDEEYIREYFSELELSERLNLTTPVMIASSQAQQSHHVHSSHLQHPSNVSLEGKQGMQ